MGARALAGQRPADRRQQVSAPPARHHSPSLVPADVLSLFGLDGPDQRRLNALSRLSFAQRLFLLAALGAQRRSEAEQAQHFLRVWLANRQVQRRASLRRRPRRDGSSPSINMNSRLRLAPSQVKVAN